MQSVLPKMIRGGILFIFNWCFLNKLLNDQSLKGSTLVVYPSSVQGLMICSSPVLRKWKMWTIDFLKTFAAYHKNDKIAQNGYRGYDISRKVRECFLRKWTRVTSPFEHQQSQFARCSNCLGKINVYTQLTW